MSDTATPIIPLHAPGNPQYDACLTRLAALEEALLSQDPLMKGHLKEIHKLLISHEELVHLLSDEQISQIMAAQQVVTNTSLAAVVVASSKSPSAGKKAAKLTLGDL